MSGRTSRARNRATLIAMVLCAVAALFAVGCGSNDDGSDGTTAASNAKGDPAVVKLVPDELKADGTLIVGTSADNPPVESIDEQGNIVGMDPDIAKAIGEVMGLKVKVVNTPFDGLLPALSSGKFHMTIAAMGDTKEREQTFDFVDYYKAGTAFYTKSSGGLEIETLADLCGHKAAAQKGSLQQLDLEKQAKKCAAEGKPPLEPLIFPDANAQALAVSSGRAEIALSDVFGVLYRVEQSNGALKMVGKPYNAVPVGIAMVKDNGFAPAIQAAVQAIMDNGTYDAIVKKYNGEAGAIPSAEINGAIS